MLKDECSPKRRLDRKTEESITSSARAGTRKRKELSIWLKLPTNVLYLYMLISYQSATLALPLRYKGDLQATGRSTGLRPIYSASDLQADAGEEGAWGGRAIDVARIAVHTLI